MFPPTLTEVFRKHGNWYIGFVRELPGANVQEHTLEEAGESLKEAVALIIEMNGMLYTDERQEA
jgi:predicted RNase H-like HicB family nuclease